MAKTWTEDVRGEETRYVSRAWHMLEVDILNRKVKRIAGYDVIIAELPGFSSYGEDEPIHMGVRWGTIGTVKPEDAAQFAEKIKVVSELAAGYKYNGYRVRYIPEKDMEPGELQEYLEYVKENLKPED